MPSTSCLPDCWCLDPPGSSLFVEFYPLAFLLISNCVVLLATQLFSEKQASMIVSPLPRLT